MIGQTHHCLGSIARSDREQHNDCSEHNSNANKPHNEHEHERERLVTIFFSNYLENLIRFSLVFVTVRFMTRTRPTDECCSSLMNDRNSDTKIGDKNCSKVKVHVWSRDCFKESRLSRGSNESHNWILLLNLLFQLIASSNSMSRPKFSKILWDGRFCGMGITKVPNSLYH